MEARDERRRAEAKERTTVRVPRVLADAARWALFDLKAPDVERFDLLIKAFVMSMLDAGEKRRADLISRLAQLEDAALEQPCEYSLSLNLSETLWSYLGDLRNQVGLSSMSELVRRILLVMETDRKSTHALRKLLLIG